MVKHVNSLIFEIIIGTFAIITWVSIPSFSQTCPITGGTGEKIVNGDFETSGGFTNDFTICSSGCSPLPGDQYVIGTNPNTYNSGYFNTMTDHTGGAGTKMAIFDFNNNSQNDAIYRTTVSVTAGKTYFFSAWFANISINNTQPCATCPGGIDIRNSPILQFKISGGTPAFSPVTVNVDSLTNNWNQYFSTYSPTASGTITIEIINLRGGNAGNDLALDDISFMDDCTKIPNINTLGQSSALPTTVSTCNVGFPYVLDPGLPGTYGYAWKDASLNPAGGSSTLSISTAPANGTKYYLCYSYIAGCPRADTVTFVTSPISVDLGADKVICAPVNYTITSGVSAPPATIIWYKNGTVISGASSSSYTATDVGTYKADVSRAGCGTATDQMTITSPASSFAGSATYCNTSNTATFSVTSGSTAVKWYTTPTLGTGSPLNPGNTNPTLSTTYSSTVSNAGCAAGLYAEDVSSFPGTLIPATTIASLPCPPVNGTDNFNGKAATLIEVNQTITLSSVDFVQNTGWGSPGTFTLTIYTNNPMGGPYCGTCTPAGNYDGPSTTAVYTTSGSFAAATQTIQTMPTSVTLAPGKYWMTLQAASTAMGLMSCNRTETGLNTWQTPFLDNTSSHNVVSAINALKDGNTGSTGALFNMKFQVGSNNVCDRLFICATLNCPAPVEFISFEGTKSSSGNLLTWETGMEKNSADFIIQRSADGINFEPIGNTPAAGNSSKTLSYHFYDHYYSGETILYYRLKQEDTNGDFIYSKTISLNTTAVGISDLKIYPVPVQQGQEVSIQLPYHSEWAYKLLDVAGKCAGEGHASGHDKISVSSHSLPSGVYIIKVQEGNNLYHGKMVVY
jgi:hypothetical protein